MGVYDQFDYMQEKADALNKLGREIDRIIGIQSTRFVYHVLHESCCRAGNDKGT